MNELFQNGLETQNMLIAQVSTLVLHASMSGVVLLLHAVLAFIVMRSVKMSPSRVKLIHNVKFVGMHCVCLLGIVNFGILQNELLKQLGIIICATLLVPVFLFWVRDSKRDRDSSSPNPLPSLPDSEQEHKAR